MFLKKKGGLNIVKNDKDLKGYLGKMFIEVRKNYIKFYYFKENFQYNFEIYCSNWYKG